MKILIKKDWDYTLFEDNGETYLEVLCGSSALYEIRIALSSSEKDEIGKDLEFAGRLAKQVRMNPLKYHTPDK